MVAMECRLLSSKYITVSGSMMSLELADARLMPPPEALTLFNGRNNENTSPFLETGKSYVKMTATWDG
jgi:hypothetical protein